jgi:hypothetical protein
VLQTWNNSPEGQDYLGPLIDSPSELDGGDILREAVLQVTEEPDPADAQRAETALEKFCTELTAETAGITRNVTANISSLKSQSDQGVRNKVEALRKLRHLLGCGRFEVLELVMRHLQSKIGESHLLWDQVVEIQESSAKVAALRRTTTEVPDVDNGLRRRAPDARPFREWTSEQDHIDEDLDHYCADQVAARLEEIVKRAAALDPVELKVTNTSVKSLFQQAHEAYLYGFEIASIALCGSLIEHALKDRLPAVPRETRDLGGLIERASSERLLAGPVLEAARKVARNRNKVMHEFTSAQKDAEEILYQTRMVLNALYSNSRSTADSR